MTRFKFIFLILVFLLTPASILAQSLLLQEKENIYVIVKDMQGNRLEGYLLLYPNEVTVSTEDNKEKSLNPSRRRRSKGQSQDPISWGENRIIPFGCRIARKSLLCERSMPLA
jgi:hypothetical protein